MPVTKNASARKSSATAKPDPESRVKSTAGVLLRSIERPAARKGVVASSVAITAADASAVLVPATPETKKSSGHKRKRLSKAFSRPLDKTLKKDTLVRERFTIPAVEFVQFALLKKRMADQGLVVKKSELVRAGLVLLSSLGDEDLNELMVTILPVG